MSHHCLKSYVFLVAYLVFVAECMLYPSVCLGGKEEDYRKAVAEAYKYNGKEDADLETALQQFEQAKSVAPDNPGNLDIDYQIALMLEKGGETGEPRFRAHVLKM